MRRLRLREFSNFSKVTEQVEKPRFEPYLKGYAHTGMWYPTFGIIFQFGSMRMLIGLEIAFHILVF